MKDIRTILNENAQDLTDEQVKTISDLVIENYRTIKDYNSKVERIKALENQTKDLTSQVESLDGNTEELEELRKTVEEYKASEERRKAEKEEQEKRESFMTVFEKALGDNEFANDLIRDTVFEKVYQKCSETTGTDAKSALKDITENMDGVFKNPQRDIRRMPTPEEIEISKNNSKKNDEKVMRDFLFGRRE